MRDPRDRALSVAKFAFTPYMQKYYPTSYANSEEYMQHEYEKLLDQWVWFVGNYLLHKKELNIQFIFYERLLHDFPAELNSLLKYLEIPLSQKQQQEIADAVTFSNMKNKSPEHLPKGRSGKWIDQLNQNQKDLVIEKAGILMQWLNYPLIPNEAENYLPCLPIFQKQNF